MMSGFHCSIVDLMSLRHFVNYNWLVCCSGNQMGDSGAHLLGKALQVNNKLTTVLWDGNGTTATGFTCLATALTK